MIFDPRPSAHLLRYTPSQFASLASYTLEPKFHTYTIYLHKNTEKYVNIIHTWAWLPQWKIRNSQWINENKWPTDNRNLHLALFFQKQLFREEKNCTLEKTRLGHSALERWVLMNLNLGPSREIKNKIVKRPPLNYVFARRETSSVNRDSTSLLHRGYSFV